MVRFKNRYILADFSHLQPVESLNEKGLLKLVKQTAEEMMGQLFLAKIAFSLQVKYMNMGKVVLRVPRDHCTYLLACLFILKGLSVIKVSGTIRGMQTKLFELTRKELRRELTAGQTEVIDRIDYS